MKQSRKRLTNSEPTGRVDVLIARLLERAVEQRNRPMEKQLYAELRDPLEKALRAYLGPRNRNMRTLKRHVEAGQRILMSIQEGRTIGV